MSDIAIWNHLKDKIYDSSITIVLISPNMKEPEKWQRSQWIPWEISYSVRETIRNDRKSHRNAVLAVILPNKNGTYSYYDQNNLFPILKENIDTGYIYVTRWDSFIKYPQGYISIAFDYMNNTSITKYQNRYNIINISLIVVLLNNKICSNLLNIYYRNTINDKKIRQKIVG